MAYDLRIPRFTSQPEQTFFSESPERNNNHSAAELPVLYMPRAESYATNQVGKLPSIAKEL